MGGLPHAPAPWCPSAWRRPTCLGAYICFQGTWNGGRTTPVTSVAPVAGNSSPLWNLANPLTSREAPPAQPLWLAVLSLPGCERQFSCCRKGPGRESSRCFWGGPFRPRREPDGSSWRTHSFVACVSWQPVTWHGGWGGGCPEGGSRKRQGGAPHQGARGRLLAPAHLPLTTLWFPGRWRSWVRCQVERGFLLGPCRSSLWEFVRPTLGKMLSAFYPSRPDFRTIRSCPHRGPGESSGELYYFVC